MLRELRTRSSRPEDTGALLTASTLIVKRIRGIRRAALAPVLPVTEKGHAHRLRATRVTPEYLLQFAYMVLLRERVMKVENRG
jgi:glycerol-3-phosphate acyltransferase PlsX